MARRSRQRHKKVGVSQIRSLSELQVTEAEAAAVLGVALSSFKEMLRIDAAARDAWESGREIGRVSIRKNQFSLAARNADMAKWLGRQYLGQTDVQRVEVSGRDGGPIQTLDLSRLDSGQRKQLREILTKAKK